jgi:hypothetical protein
MVMVFSSARSGDGSSRCGAAGTHGERTAGSDIRTSGRTSSLSDDPAPHQFDPSPDLAEENTMTIPPDLEAQILRYYHVEKWRIGTIARQLHVHHGKSQSGLKRPI